MNEQARKDQPITTEATVIEIMEDILGVQDVRPGDRFLDIGGNSLNLVRVLKRIQEKTGVRPGPRMFFDKTQSTAAAIGAAIDSQLEADA